MSAVKSSKLEIESINEEHNSQENETEDEEVKIRINWLFIHLVDFVDVQEYLTS